MQLRDLGDAYFELSDADTTVLIDPFLTGYAKAAAAADEVSPTTTVVVLEWGDTHAS